MVNDHGRRVGSRSVPLLLVAVLLGALAGPATVSAQFDPVADLSAVGAMASGVEVAIDGNGVSTVVWNLPTLGGTIVQARRLSATGLPGPVLDLSLGAAGLPNPKVVADASGVTTVVWTQETFSDSVVQARRIAADGTAGPVLDLSPGGPRPAAHTATVDPSGNVMVAWLISGLPGARVGLRQISAAGVVGPLVEAELDTVGFLLGVDADGNATVAWFDAGSCCSGLNTFEVRARRVDADGTVHPPRDIVTIVDSGLFGGGFSIGMTVDPSGPATVMARTPSGPPQGSNALFMRRLAPDGTLGTLHFDPCLRVGDFAAVSGAGVTTIVMQCDGFAPFTSTAALQIDAADQLGPLLELSTGFGQSRRLALDETGRVTAVWLAFDASGMRVQARQIFPGGQLGNLVEVAFLAGAALDAVSDAHVATDATGLATVAWLHALPDGVSRIVQAAHGSLTVFADVTRTHPLRPWVEALFAAAITGGCGLDPLVYCPDAGVGRDQVAVFLVRAIHGAGFDPPAATGTMFTDVPADHPFAKWIEQLARDGITGGCGPGLYCPGAPVTRGQVAVFILRAVLGAGFVPPPATGTPFTDVPADHPFAAWIEELARRGITGGCAPAAFCPAAVVTRAQVAVFLARALDLPI